MKILFTGPILDFSGFAHVSRDLLHALAIDPRIDVVARPLHYDQIDASAKFIVPDWMRLLLNKDLMNVDLCLQMTTCNIEANPVPGIVNGLYTFFETDRLQSSWAAKANEFNFIIVPSRFNAQTLIKSGVRVPIMVAAPPCDASIYEKSYQPFELKNSAGRTIFYNICQLSTKKGIDCLLRAYYAAFASVPNEVLLVLKTYIGMHDRTNDLEIVKQYINSIKTRCRIPVQNLPPVLPLVYTMSDDEIHSLHARGDAYVCSSRGEGWGLPVFDALAHGKTVISHAAGGLGDFITKENALVYGGCQSLFFDMPHSDPGLFTGLEQCFEPSVAELAMVMQHFFLLKKGSEAGELNESNQKEWEAVLNRRNNAKLVAERMDYRNVSQQIVEQLISVHDTWKTSGTARFVVTPQTIEETL